MVTICKVFEQYSESAEEYPMFELLIELLKLGVKSGNGGWAQSYQTANQVREIFTKMQDTGSFDRLKVALNDLNFDIYDNSGLGYLSFCRIIEDHDISLTSDIYPESFKAFIKSQLPCRISRSCFWEQCRDTLINIIIPYLDDLRVPYDDLLEFPGISEYVDFSRMTLIDSPRFDIYKKFNIERFELR